MKESEIENLASEILKHKRLYYSGHAVITDAEYDALEDALSALAPDHPVLQSVGVQQSPILPKVIHSPKMLSLQKTYSPNDILNFLKDHDSLVCMEKIDGMAICLEYSKTGHLFRVSTRGNGLVGEDITQQAQNIPSIPKILPLDVLGVQLNDSIHKIEIRGEVFFPLSKFEKYASQFDSYRNAVAGTFGRKNVAEAAHVLKSFDFGAYDAFVFSSKDKTFNANELAHTLGLSKALFSNKIGMLSRLGFWKIPFEIIRFGQFKNPEGIENFIETFSSQKRDYQIDGLVFRIDDEVLWENFGTTAHHPRGSLAFKKHGEIGVTRIVEIETNIGRTGKMALRAKLEPLYLSGANISHASLHSAEFVEKGGYGVGSLVSLKRSGEVIPSILNRVSDPDTPYQLPTHCPCGFPMVRIGPHLYCNEAIVCPEKDQEFLVHFVKSLNTKGISEKTISLLWENGLLRQPADLFKIKEYDLLELDRFAKTSAQNFIQTIHNNKILTLATFLTSLGLKGCGTNKCTQLSKFFRGFEQFKKTVLGPTPLSHFFYGWNEKASSALQTSFKKKEAQAQECLKYIKIENSTKSLEVKDIFENMRLPFGLHSHIEISKKLNEHILNNIRSLDQLFNLTWLEVKDVDSKISESDWDHFLNMFKIALETPPPTPENGLVTIYELLAQCLKRVSELKGDPKDGHKPLLGLKFCITGDVTGGRMEFAKRIEALGGVFSSQVDKNTHYLISNSLSQSKKYKQAINYGTKIITEDEFKELIL